MHQIDFKSDPMAEHIKCSDVASRNVCQNQHGTFIEVKMKHRELLNNPTLKSVLITYWKTKIEWRFEINIFSCTVQLWHLVTLKCVQTYVYVQYCMCVSARVPVFGDNICACVCVLQTVLVQMCLCTLKMCLYVKSFIPKWLPNIYIPVMSSIISHVSIYKNVIITLTNRTFPLSTKSSGLALVTF